MYTPKSFKIFLKAVGQGCVSGNISEWPQLKPACKWALNEITCLEQEIKELKQELLREIK